MAEEIWQKQQRSGMNQSASNMNSIVVVLSDLLAVSVQENVVLLAVLWLSDEAPVHLPDPWGISSEDTPGEVEGGEGVGLLVHHPLVLDHGVRLQPGTLVPEWVTRGPRCC